MNIAYECNFAKPILAANVEKSASATEMKNNALNRQVKH